ncbi:MAG: DUF929 family protein [Actinomycetota bacterium]
MGKRTAERRQRARAPQQQSSTRWPLIAVIAVAAAAAAMVVWFLVRSPQQSTAEGSAAAIAKLTSVPAKTLEKVGFPDDLPPIRRLPADVPTVERDGKPVVTYIAAEWCPFCAMERWPLVVALSRFGTFSNLATTTSAAEDVYPNTPSVSFHGATYTSDYLVFSSAEMQTNQYEPLDPLTAEQQRLFNKYDRMIYTGGSDRGIPFIMIGNLYAWAGATYDPNVLDGLTFDQIANRLANPNNKVAQAINGAANQITVMVCQLTDGQPQEVCSAPYIQDALAGLQGQ